MATPNNGHTHTEDVGIPKTISGGWLVFFSNLITLAFIWALVALGLLLFTEDAHIWGGFITLGILGSMIQGGKIAVNIPDWYGVQVWDPIFRRRRVLFQGFHFKTWWEKLEKLESLKREVETVITASLTTNRPAEKIDIECLVHLRLDTRPKSAAEDALNFIAFTSIEAHALEELVKSRILNFFGSYYGKKPMKELLDLRLVQKEIEREYEEELHKLAHEYGGHLGIELRKSMPDKATQDMHRTSVMASSLMDARAELIKHRTVDGQKIPGMKPEMANRAGLLLDPNTDYTEQHTAIKLDVTGLENLTHANIVAPGGIAATPKTGGNNNPKK